MGTIAFTKVEGLGNDFLIVDRRRSSSAGLDADIRALQALAGRLCDRRRGVGGDGILVVGGPRARACASMTVINFDGSRPEMCGNGLRCVALYVAHRGGRPGEELDIDTDAGPKRCLCTGDEVRVDMGPARILGRASPVADQGREFVAIDMGNPHAVCLVDGHEDLEELARTRGPQIELDPCYAPAKTNVEFARVDETGARISLWVWERGVGITQACGTGACATAVAAVSEGLARADADIEVQLPGGTLTIRVPSAPGAGVWMTGPAREVFSGTVSIPSFEGWADEA